ncbi:hypothetical protein ACFQNG_03710 [Laceyella putida]|uniref:Response regulatory domain-containing protein n=1 Tax=Laceyella putida TaxID=110101 RepID=A0ABW2RH08_9BACL
MRKILIVDDEEKIREVLVSYLKKEGYVPLEAANGTIYLIKNLRTL